MTTFSSTAARRLDLVLAVAVALPLLAQAACSSSPSDPASEQAPPASSGFPIYVQPTLVCRPPLPGESPGRSDGGEVCTMEAVAAATEEGRRFHDYADCSVVRTQRPYYPMPAGSRYLGADDPLLSDEAYATELAWVTRQLASQGCSCCHSADGPQGPVRFSIDAPGNWVGMMSDRDVAGMLAWYDVSMLDVWPPAINNGFERIYGMPSTDSGRAVAFFSAEATRRGLTKDQFADAPPTAARLVEQRDFQPARCAPGEGIASDGTITWLGTPARYLWVLAAGSANPTQVPDRDTPSGTLWRLDVPTEAPPLLSGTVTYGQVPAGVTQPFPASKAPGALTPGQDYYLYVDTDFFAPTARCLFTYQ